MSFIGKRNCNRNCIRRWGFNRNLILKGNFNRNLKGEWLFNSNSSRALKRNPIGIGIGRSIAKGF